MKRQLPVKSVGGPAGLILGAAILAQLGPAVSAWRRMRSLVAPGLAGVGALDHLALTFDDGPNPNSTPAFLDRLDELGWKATFFMLGSQVALHPRVAEEVASRGHEIAVHGYIHTSHLRRPPSWVTRDVEAASSLLGEVTGVRPRWFRPPYGALSSSSLLAARRSGLRTVLWTTWGHDWRADATPTAVVQDVERTRVGGATVLLHDSDITSAPGSWRSALGALEPLAEVWADDGLLIGPLRDHSVAGRII